MPVEGRPNRSLADDPNFSASLSELDRGLTGDKPKGPPRRRSTDAPPLPIEPIAPPPTSTGPLAPPATHVGGLPEGGRRLLIDLFPLEAPGPVVAPPIAPAAPQFSSDTEDYETFYGLHERPFSLSTDPKFFYHSVGHDEAAQTLLGAIGRREKFVVLTGEPGLGKTTLCRAIVDQLDRRTLTSLVAEPFVSAEDLLKTVLIDFGVISREDLSHGRLANQSRTDLMTALRDFLISLAALQAFAVIILDDAHEMPIDMLEQIRVLMDSVGDEALLQVILVGGPSLTKTLGRAEVRQMNGSIAVRAKLRPIAADEVFGYITHRLSVSGASPRVEFDEAALARVFELSAGVPRTINVLCDRTLEVGFKKSASVFDRSLVDQAADELDLAPANARPSIAQTVVTAAGFVLLVLLGALLAAFVFRSDLAALGVDWAR